MTMLLCDFLRAYRTQHWRIALCVAEESPRKIADDLMGDLTKTGTSFLKIDESFPKLGIVSKRHVAR